MHVESLAEVVIPVSSLRLSMQVMAGFTGLCQPWDGSHRMRWLAGSSLWQGLSVAGASDAKSLYIRHFLNS